MPRKSKAILDEEADYAILGEILKDKTLPAYQRLKAGGHATPFAGHRPSGRPRRMQQPPRAALSVKRRTPYTPRPCRTVARAARITPGAWGGKLSEARTLWPVTGLAIAWSVG